MRLNLVCIGLLLASCQPTFAKNDLVYIRCKFEGPGDFRNLELNFYIDESGKKLLNEGKAEFGETRQWSKNMITIATPTKNGDDITFINRLNGVIHTYTDGKEMGTLHSGQCKKSSPPSQQF